MVFKDVRDLILSKEIRWRELKETWSSTLNIVSKDRSNDKTQIRAYQNQDGSSLDPRRKR